MHCQMPWDIKRIGSLLKSSACRPAGPLSRTAVAASAAAAASELDTYSGVNVPGQLWNVYKSKNNETANEFNLEKKLTDLLQPSTSSTAVWLEKRREGQPPLLPAYLRLKQKPMNKQEWLVDAEKGELHNGAHFRSSSPPRIQVIGAQPGLLHEERNGHLKMQSG